MPGTFFRCYKRKCQRVREMPKPYRILIEGGMYHVYNRIGRGERVFDEENGSVWTSTICDLAEGLTSWCGRANC